MRLINLRAIVKYFSLGIIISSILHLSVAAELEQANDTHQSSTNYEWVTKRTALGCLDGLKDGSQCLYVSCWLSNDWVWTFNNL